MNTASSSETMPVDRKEDRKESEKFLLFERAVNIDIKDDPHHFLKVGTGRTITFDFLEGPEPPTPSQTLGYKRITHPLLRKAIWDFYQVFDPELYKKWEEKNNVFGLVTRNVWARFKDSYSVWRDFHRALAHDKNLKMEEFLKRGREEAHLKRQEKEKRQMLVMGGGDIELGRKKFVERMHVQKKNKEAKYAASEDSIPLALEKEFSKWLESKDGKNTMGPMVDYSSRQFQKNDRCLLCFHKNKKPVTDTHLWVSDRKQLVDCLRQLADHKDSKNLFVNVRFEWDEKIPYANPSAHNHIYDGIISLTNHGRIGQGHTMNITGFTQKGDKAYVTSSEVVNAFRLFPKKYQRFSARNPKIKYPLHVLYNCENSISWISVTRHEQPVCKTHHMSIGISSTGRSSVDPLVIFNTNIMAVMDTTLSSIARKEALREQRILEAKKNGESRRHRGESKYDKKDFNEDANRGRTLLNLISMLNNGLITKKDFEDAKSAL